jgi:hypothetical protein|tara:strand:+ start:279 stop:1967 length:1689 start_codon:yes stop_codon:yes gene_type:complete
MNSSCANCDTGFEVTDSDLAFLDKVSPVFAGKKHPLPPPTHCPECRQQRRLVWQNNRSLYKRKCDATGKELISNFSPQAVFPIYEKEYWFSDKWNALSYGRDFDFSKTFAENFRELQKEVPRFHIQQQEPMENSKHCNFASNCKNCYLLFDSDFCRDSCYCYSLKKSESCFDSSFLSESELCYECVNCSGCYNVQYAQNCRNCSDSVFLESCVGCKHCAFSVNLKNSEYCFANEQLSKEKYEEKLKEMSLDSYASIAKYYEEFPQYCAKQIHKYQQGEQNENVTGDYIYNSKNIKNGFNIQECWDIAYCVLINRAKNCMDVSSFGEDIEKIYECATAGLNTQNCAFCFTNVVGSHDLYYCDTAYSSENCFGCVCIHRASHCILNKQYSKEEYEKQVSKIIEHMKETGEWGEFFSITSSPFAYNETMAQEYFSMTKEEVEAKGWRWRDIKDEIPEVEKTIPGNQLPDSIDDIPDDILNWAIECEVTQRPFRIVSQELAFYRSMKLPIPHLHPDLRHKKRMEMRNPRKMFDRQCDNCSKEIQTTYAPDRPEKVLCEECYLKEVY